MTKVDKVLSSALFLKFLVTLYIMRLVKEVMLPRVTSCHHLLTGTGSQFFPNLTWDPGLCTMKQYNRHDIRSCSLKLEEKTGRPTVIGYSGDSSIMEVANATHALLDFGFYEIKSSHTMMLWYPFENVHIAFQTNVHMAHRKLLPFLHEGQVPDVLVVDGGAWHFAGRDALGSLTDRHMFQEASSRHLAQVLQNQFNSSRIIWIASHPLSDKFSEVRGTPEEVRIYHNTHYVPLADLFVNHYVTSNQKNIAVWSSTTTSLIPAMEAAGIDGFYDFVHFMPEISIIRTQIVLNYMCNGVMELPEEYCCVSEDILNHRPGFVDICFLLLFVVCCYDFWKIIYWRALKEESLSS